MSHTHHIAIEAPESISAAITMPASKSISNRALIINALSQHPCSLLNLSPSDDTATLAKALAQAGDHINIGAAGTAMRFLTAYFATVQGQTTVLDGSERMRMRPVKPLVDALRQLGADISYCSRNGFPPLKITGGRLTPRHLDIDGGISSQFVSAILMIAPTVGDTSISITGKALSMPYIDMTLTIMNQFGISAVRSGQEITIRKGIYSHTGSFDIEGDWSAVSYWVAMAALTVQPRVTLLGLSPHSVQGDSGIMQHLPSLGLHASWSSKNALCLDQCGSRADFFEADFSGTPDIAQTFIATLCLLGIPFRIHGLSNLKIKETDRLAAMTAEMAKIGYRLTAGNDTISWLGEKCQPTPGVPSFDTHKDHRMAMSMALAATRCGKIIINDPDVVSKSYPAFWDDLALAGFKITHAS